MLNPITKDTNMLNKNTDTISSYEFFPVLKRAILEDYVVLFDKAFKSDTKLNKEYLQWQYIDNPNGKVIGVDAFLDNVLVAHYAIIPRQYNLAGKRYSGALSVNTATHPKHQGKRLFTSLAERTYKIAENNGIQFVVGVANEHSITGFVKRLGFVHLGQISLNLSLGGAKRNKNKLKLETNENWLTWRLGNPSRNFTKIEHADGTTTIRTMVNRIPFNIYRDSAKSVSICNLPKGHNLLPVFTPNFGFTGMNIFRLPNKLKPSPWHLIWRTLDNSIDMNIMEKLQFDGFAMDTF